MQMCNGNLAINRVAGKDRTQELECHLSRDKIEISANLRGQRGRKQTLCHQSALLIGLQVMYTLVTRHPAEKTNILFRESALPRDDVADVHRYAWNASFPISRILIIRSLNFHCHRNPSHVYRLSFSTLPFQNASVTVM
jgi:hypothetical protein